MAEREDLGTAGDEVEDDGTGALDDVENLELLEQAAGTAAAAAAESLAQPDPIESLYKFHPETILDYAEKVMAAVPLRVATGVAAAAGGAGEETAIDPAHRSQPFLTVYERTKILGTRSNQLAQGARPYVVVPEHVTTPLEIAKLELEQRRLPFIVKRPMPDGSFEYWRLSDLMIL